MEMEHHERGKDDKEIDVKRECHEFLLYMSNENVHYYCLCWLPSVHLGWYRGPMQTINYYV